MTTIGTAGNDLLRNDDPQSRGVTLRGLGGDDTIHATDPRDIIEGGPGDDQLFGVSTGGATVSYAHASGGVSVSLKLAGPQTIGGGEGVDTLSNFTELVGSAFGDTLVASDRLGQLTGGDGNDSLLGGAYQDHLDGGNGDDTIDATANASGLSDYVNGGAGNDVLTADSNSEVHGGAGDDRIWGARAFGETGNDTIIGVVRVLGFGAELHGNAGADSILGTDLSDVIFGGSGDNTLSGGSGDDVFKLFDGAYGDDGAPGRNIIDGGAGSDVLDFGASFGRLTIDLAKGVAHTDAFQGLGVGAQPYSIPAGDHTFTGIEVVMGSQASDSVIGSAGADTLSGQGGADTILGGQGDDSIEGDGAGIYQDGLPIGGNYLRGDEGNDQIRGGSGFDDINGNMGNDTGWGGRGDDWVVGGKDQDLLFGEEGNDIVYGNMGDDTCDGGYGDDLVRGGQGNDTLTGGVGNDWLSGDRGDDTISGGAGADIFHTFSGVGIDRVLDFSLAEGDRVQLDPGTTYVVRQVGGDTVIDMGAGDQMILVGVQSSTLTGGWLFVQ